MEYLTIDDIKRLHDLTLNRHGGSAGIRDSGALLSSLEQPLQTFFGAELYPSIPEKAAALCYFIAENHPFVDGNKRAAHASMEHLLNLNGYDLVAPTDESEQVVLAVASGEMSREALTDWVLNHIEAMP